MFVKTKVLTSVLALAMAFIVVELFISGYSVTTLLNGAGLLIVFIGINALSIYVKKKEASRILFYLMVILLVFLTYLVLPYEPIYVLCVYLAFVCVYSIIMIKPFVYVANSYGIECLFWGFLALLAFTIGTSGIRFVCDLPNSLIYTACFGIVVCGETSVYVANLDCK